MSQENQPDVKQKNRHSRLRLALGIAIPLIIALACFIVLAILPTPENARLKDPLRSLLTGFGVLGIAAPLCIAGFTLKKRFTSSPYYEGKFIATVLNVFGFACVAAGLACLIVCAYDWIMQFVKASS